MKTLDKIKSALIVFGAYLWICAIYLVIFGAVAGIPLLIIFALVKYIMS